MIAVLAAVSGFLCVAIGAFGAHLLSDPRAEDLVATGVRYQILHTLAVYAVLSLHPRPSLGARLAPVFFLFGIAVFCGSLYAMAVGAPSVLGMVTPVGGVAFLIGWASLALASLPARSAAASPLKPRSAKDPQ